ncbi:hypothetical protein VM99_26320 [Pseudomonas chlororaphis]|uniref:Uncharacterized protein n=1 Tax=Pseudomonas chlororaphis TaxID=587753 RepID=A0A0G3GJH3_9PSED|nr:hypothetical protein VM99_26320 [Pseudomonas chlororaphis]
MAGAVATGAAGMTIEVDMIIEDAVIMTDEAEAATADPLAIRSGASSAAFFWFITDCRERRS